MSRRVGLWIRVSTEDQVKDESPEHHERRGRAYAESRGWNVAQVYRLDAVSGKSVMEHPECRRMLADLESGAITGLIFSKLARLARNTRELLEFAEIFENHGGHLISLQESIDTSTPAGRLFYTMIAALAQWEREEIASRVAASVVVRAKMGKPLGGAAPYGYRWEGQKLVPDEREAPVRKLLHELFVEHRRKRTVARLLNDRGYRTRSGSLWGMTAIARNLDDPTPKGFHRRNWTTSAAKNKAWSTKPESEWVFNEVEPILPTELWDQCQAILAEQRRSRKPVTKRARHLFAGLAVCHCGSKMYVPSNSPKYICYACRNKIPVDDLEAIFREQLHGFFLSEEDVAKHLEQADETILAKQALLASLEVELASVRAEMNKIYRLYLADQIAVENFGEHHRPLEERARQLSDEIPTVQGELDFLKIQLASSDEIVKKAQDLYGHWADLTPDEKRRIVEQVVDRIVVGKDEITIEAAYLPLSELETVAEGHRTLRDSARRPS